MNTEGFGVATRVDDQIPAALRDSRDGRIEAYGVAQGFGEGLEVRARPVASGRIANRVRGFPAGVREELLRLGIDEF